MYINKNNRSRPAGEKEIEVQYFSEKAVALPMVAGGWWPNDYAEVRSKVYGARRRRVCYVCKKSLVIKELKWDSCMEGDGARSSVPRRHSRVRRAANRSAIDRAPVT